MKVSSESDNYHSGHLRDGKDISALVVLDEVGHSEHYGAHAETEGPGEEQHPPPLAGLHDDGVPHALVDAQVPVHGQHHQRHQRRPHDGGHQALDCAAGE